MAKKVKLKKFNIYWEASVYGCQTIEAFDEDDAREQFNSSPDISDCDDQRMNAEIDEIVLVKS